MCTTKDETAVAMMQNLCSMLSGEMTSISMMMNGIKMIECNMMMTWTSGDNMMCKIIQKCCDCMMNMMECGCTAVICMNNSPVCCCC
ncbi:hypothetical protein [Clostridium tyrobutyricum]|nr:hypothetical protein [Clostridium tyrobutyricum]